MVWQMGDSWDVLMEPLGLPMTSVFFRSLETSGMSPQNISEYMCQMGSLTCRDTSVVLMDIGNCLVPCKSLEDERALGCHQGHSVPVCDLSTFEQAGDNSDVTRDWSGGVVVQGGNGGGRNVWQGSLGAAQALSGQGWHQN